MLSNFFYLVNVCFILCLPVFSSVKLGVDRFFSENIDQTIKKKKIALFTNHTGINSVGISTIDCFIHSKKKKYQLLKIFTPEHGLCGMEKAGKKVGSSSYQGIPVISLYGKTRRPTAQMLQDVDVVICDIQDIGCRSYTYCSSLFYIMEEAAKYKKKVIVFDRPNPMGNIVDGPVLEDAYRSFIGYINVPYCHGMTIGELAMYFNGEYKVGCDLQVIKMVDYNRKMNFSHTKLQWVPTSPNIPEATTPYFYASTGIIGELDVVNIGVGYTLPFKLIGADWINAEEFAKALNSQSIPGVHFSPFHYKPFFGSYQDKSCHGIIIQITDYQKYRPVAVQYLLLGVLKSLYPDKVIKALKSANKTKIEMFHKANGTDQVFEILLNEKYPFWKLLQFQDRSLKDFFGRRSKYIFAEYDQ